MGSVACSWARAVVAGLAGAPPALATSPSWVASWGLPINSSRTTSFADRTIRDVAQVSLGGSRVRVRLSNDNGTQPITLSDLHIGLAGSGAAVSGDDLPLTVGGASSVTIPAGGSVLSDPVALTVPDGGAVAVSVYTAADTGRGTGDNEIGAYYTAPGDHAADTAAGGFGARSAGGWFVTAVDVYTPNDGAIVGFGDSITAGFNAGGVGWPSYLAERLLDLAASGGPRVAVVNMGISGNEVTRDRPNFGVSALHRWQRDVLDQTGVRLVLMMEGINDIGADAVPASAIEADYRTLQQQTLAAHVNLLVSPLTPAGDPAAPASQYGGDYSTPLGIAIRHEFDDWLRASSLYSPVLDFAAAAANPADPDELAPALDSGDHLHPGTAGQQAMAASIDLHALLPFVLAPVQTLPVGGTVPATLSLTLGGPASFGAFAPGVDADYTAATTATVVSTAGDAALSVADPSSEAPGHLVNGAFALPSPLRVSANGGAPVTPSGSPGTLLTYSGPVASDQVALTFSQHIGARDPLRTGSYAKTLTFTLSTTRP